MAAMHYRADQLGSLLRPAELLEGRAAYAAGRMSSEQLRDLEDTAILDALEMQRQTGIDIFTDGEYRRGTFRSSFADSVEGMVAAESGRHWSGQSAGGPGDTERVVGGRLRPVRRLTAHESSFLKKRAPGPCKVTVPSAGYLASASLPAWHHREILSHDGRFVARHCCDHWKRTSGTRCGRYSLHSTGCSWVRRVR